MRIEGTKQVTDQRSDNSAAGESRQGSVNQKSATPNSTWDPSQTVSRALATAAPAVASVSPPPYRQATFLAHLIATKEQAPQTRERRRADPRDAVAAYRAMAALVGR